VLFHSSKYNRLNNDKDNKICEIGDLSGHVLPYINFNGMLLLRLVIIKVIA